MVTSRNKNTDRLPGPTVVALATFLIFGAVFATMGVWSLVRPGPSPDAIPGWPFAIIGSLAACFSWAMLWKRRAWLALMPITLLCLLALGAGTYTAWHQHRKVTAYRPAKAWVLWAEVQHRVIESEDGDTHAYTPAVRYEYEVAGRTFSGETVYPMPCSLVDPFESRGAAREILEVVSPGVKEGINRLGQTSAEADLAKAYPAEAHYNPRDPADSFLVKRYSWVPFAMIHGAGGVLLVIAFAFATQSSLADRRKRAVRWTVVAIWHTTGLLVAGDCLYVALCQATIVGPAAGYLVAVYEVIGLVPLTIALPRTGWLGRIKDALTAGGIAGMVAGFFTLAAAAFLGAVATFVAEVVFHRSMNILVWALLGALVVSCAVAVVAAVTELVSGEEPKHR